MRKGGIFLFILFILFLNSDISLVRADGLTHLVITEIQTTGGTGQSDNEYVEIYNPTGSDIDLSALPLKLHLRSGTGSDSNRPLTFVVNVITSHGYFLIGPASGYLGAVPLDATYSASGTKLVDNGSAYISNSSTAGSGVIDKIGWGSQPAGGFELNVFGSNPAGGGVVGRKWDSVSSNYVETDDNSQDLEIQVPTPKAQNINHVEIPIVYSTKILLNEIFPAPGSTTDWDGNGLADSNDEWIELINLDDGQIDLAGWTLDDIADGGSDPYTIPVNTKIDPDGFKVFYKKDTSLVLNNTGDSVILKNPNGDIVDQYSFTTTSTDKSFSRDTNLATSIWISNYPASPGRLNIAALNIPPTANAGASVINAKVGENINFNGSGSSDPDGSIVSYQWSLGDGQTSSGAQSVHSYSSAGTYTITLTVRDDDGASTSASTTVSVVQNTAPVPYQNQYSSDIKVVEILPSPEIGEPEYIKIENFGTIDVDIKNWYIDDDDGGSKPYLIDYDLVAKPGAIITFYDTDTKISLNNGGDSARVIDPDQKVISSAVYIESAPKNTPYIYDSGAWKWKTASVPDNSKKVDVPPVANPAQEKSPAVNAEAPKLDVKIPDVKTIEVLEPPVITNQNLNNKNAIPVTATISQVIINAGTLTSAENKKEMVAPQKDFAATSSVSGQLSQEGMFQKPIVVFPSAIISLFLITKALLRPEDWKKIWEKLFKDANETKNEFENLFK